MDYRLVATKYYYGAPGRHQCEEELIHADGVAACKTYDVVQSRK